MLLLVHYVDLATDLAAGPCRGMDVHISNAGTHCGNEFVPLSRCYSLCICAACNVLRPKGPSYCRWALGARLCTGRPVTEIGTEKNDDPAIHTHLPKMDVRLKHVTLESRIAHLPLDL